MNKHTLKSFDDRLDALTEQMVEMGALVRESVRMAGTSLVKPHESVLKEVRKNDKDINVYDKDIQQHVTEIIALMNPMAVDLRFITSALKISVALERAGDIAKSITKRMVRLPITLPVEAEAKLSELVAVVMSQIDSALEAVRTRCTDHATEVWKRDSEANDLCSEVFDVIRDEMKKNPDNAPHLADVMFAAKNFERLGDYAANIAKTVYYVTSGETPKKKDVM